MREVERFQELKFGLLELFHILETINAVANLNCTNWTINRAKGRFNTAFKASYHLSDNAHALTFDGYFSVEKSRDSLIRNFPPKPMNATTDAQKQLLNCTIRDNLKTSMAHVLTDYFFDAFYKANDIDGDFNAEALQCLYCILCDLFCKMFVDLNAPRVLRRSNTTDMTLKREEISLPSMEKK